MGLGWFVSEKRGLNSPKLKYILSTKPLVITTYIKRRVAFCERNLSSHFFPERNGTKIELIRKNTVLTETKWFLFYLNNSDTTKVTFFESGSLLERWTLCSYAMKPGFY